MTNYEKQYQKACDVCGLPCKELEAFFDDYHKKHAKVLDLGCGQGRDALFIARLGHHVTGMDISTTGISQMLENAKQEKLNINGVVGDVLGYHPSGEYDIVILDRVLHMLKLDSERRSVLEKASQATITGGFILIADTPKHLQLIRSFFEDQPDIWAITKDKKGFIFTRKS